VNKLKLTEQKIFEKVKEIIIEQLCVNDNDVTREAVLTDDLGADSLDQIEMVMALEEAFGDMEIPDGEAEKFSTVGDVVKYIQQNI
jgi:acyl carrier protein